MKPSLKQSGNYHQSSEDLKSIQSAQAKLSALNHDLRQKILKLITTKGRLTVTEIYVKLRIEQSVASQHLSILREHGFVETEREGKFVWYAVSDSAIKNTVAKAKSI